MLVVLAGWVFCFPRGCSSAAVGDTRHLVQLWETAPGTLRGQLRSSSVALAGACIQERLHSLVGRKNIVLGQGQLGSGPQFCVVLGRSLSFSDHLFLYPSSDKVGLCIL